jgi:hypothetical protein
MCKGSEVNGCLMNLRIHQVTGVDGTECPR